MVGRKLMNPVDAFLWGEDANGNPVQYRVGNEGQLGLGAGSLTPLGWEQVVLSGTDVASLNPPSGTTHMFASIAGTAEEYLRMSFSNTPTQTRGSKVIVGDYIDMTDPLSNYANMISALKMIRDTAATQNIVLDVEYFAQAEI